jgi:hypothetical protein
VAAYRNDHPVPQRIPGPSRKLDAVAVLTARLLPAPREIPGSPASTVTVRLVIMPASDLG